MKLLVLSLPPGSCNSVLRVCFSERKLILPLLLFLFLHVFARVHAQPLGPYTVTRVEVRTIDYQFSDSIADYPIFQRTAMLQRTSKDSVVISVYANSDFKTTTYHMYNSDYEDWMRMPYKTVTDKKFYKAYDAAGVLMSSMPHAPEYKGHYTTLKSHLSSTGKDINPDYTQLTTTLKSSLLAEGFVMTNMGDGTFRFTRDSSELYYNNIRKSNHLVLRHTDGSLKYELLRDFRVNDLGQTVLWVRQERYPDQRFPDDCVMVVMRVEYPYYKTTPGVIREADDSPELPALDIFPVPADKQFTIQVPACGTTSMVHVYSIDGTCIWTTSVPPDCTSIETNAETWTSGIYVVSFTGACYERSQSIIVQH